MAKLSEMYPSKYLRAADFGDDDQIVTIKAVEFERVGIGRDAEDKPIIYFKELDKGLVCNKTNANSIAKLAKSDDTDDWIGTMIALYATEVPFKDEMVLSIRVRLKAPKPKAAAAPPKKLAKVADADMEEETEDDTPF